MAKSTFRFNRERAAEVYLPLHRSYVGKTHAFSVLNAENSTPQNVFIPPEMKKGSSEHVRYLFFDMLVTLRSKSNVGFEKMVVLHERHPELWTEAACNLEPSDVIYFWRDVEIPHQHGWARYWIDFARALFGSYRGDPLFLISEAQRKAGGGDVTNGFLKIKKELRKRKQPCFDGLGPKLFSLFCIFCEELELVRGITDTMPVDVWLQNLALSTGVVTPRNGSVRIDSTELAEFLRMRLTRFAREHGLSFVDMSVVQWLQGSEVCNKCYKLRNLEGTCSIHKLCSGSLHADPYWKKGKWRLDIPREPKGNQTFLPPENVDFTPEKTLLHRKSNTGIQEQAQVQNEQESRQLDLFDD